VAELNKLLLKRRAPVAPAPKAAASFAADVARAQAGTTLLSNLTARVDTLERRLHYTALIDELTGLYNQRFFYTQIVREANRFQRQSRPFTIIFEEVGESNPEPGEPPYRASREVLRGLSGILRERVRQGVDMAFRLRGNEFAAMLIDAGEKEAAGVAVRLENAFGKLGFSGLALKTGIREFSSEEQVDSVLTYARRRLQEA
jgi:diguanylate cyclase (GGDEF)-like protein